MPKAVSFPFFFCITSFQIGSEYVTWRHVCQSLWQMLVFCQICLILKNFLHISHSCTLVTEIDGFHSGRCLHLNHLLFIPLHLCVWTQWNGWVESLSPSSQWEHFFLWPEYLNRPDKMNRSLVSPPPTPKKCFKRLLEGACTQRCWVLGGGWILSFLLGYKVFPIPTVCDSVFHIFEQAITIKLFHLNRSFR